MGDTCGDAIDINVKPAHIHSCIHIPQGLGDKIPGKGARTPDPEFIGAVIIVIDILPTVGTHQVGDELKGHDPVIPDRDLENDFVADTGVCEVVIAANVRRYGHTRDHNIGGLVGV